MRNISKSFSGVNILRQVSFEVQEGEIHALLGENGAGKSTLMRILAGVIACDSGRVWWRGQAVQFKTPREAQQAGIAFIHQETSLIPRLSVAENIFLGHEPAVMAGLPFIDWNRMYAQARQLLAQLNVEIDPAAPAGSLSAAEQQMVEVCKALRQSAPLLIMDEPTASLAPPEVDTLFEIMRRLTAQGAAIVFISHRLEEVSRISQRATILRDGFKVGTVPLPETSLAELARLISGRQMSDKFPRRRATPGREVLRVSNLTVYGVLDNIEFHLQAGEIVGVTGLMGSGGTALARALFGLDRIDEGEIYREGRRVLIDSPQTAIALGIGLLTEDRAQEGLIPDLSTGENITLTALERHWPGPLLPHDAEKDLAQQYIKRLNIWPATLNQPARFLSGGMQQKVVLSKWMAAHSQVMIFDQPTRGIDVSSRVEIYRYIANLAQRGIAVLLISSDFPEVLGMCDRIMVLHQGQVVGSLNPDEASVEIVLAYATSGQPGWLRKD